MTPAQREAAKRLISTKLRHSAWEEQIVALLRELLAEPEPAPGYCKHCKQYTIEEPLPAEPQGEPVAWMAESGSGTVRFTNIGQSADELESLGWTIAPLYAAPQQRKPSNKMHACDDPLCAVCGHGITGEPT